MIHKKISAAQKPLKLSLVIPAYNEEYYLKTCLESVMAQTRRADEILVVDNNSSDATVAVANSFRGVGVVSARRQGVLYARNTGFDQASGDIICRLDADTILPPGWTAAVVDYFQDHPKDAALTGHCYFYDFPFRRAFQAAHHLVYYRLQKLLTGTEILWGSNMAIRRDVWQSVEATCSQRPDIHEDIDLSFKLQRAGYMIKRLPRLEVGVSMRRGELDPRNVFAYLWPWPKTYWADRRYLSGVLIAAGVIVCWLISLPVGVTQVGLRKL